MQYYYRAKRTAGALPPARRLQWLQAKDVDERSEWVTWFRESTASLGVVIKEVYAARDAHWAAGVHEQTGATQAVPATASKAAASTNLLTQGKPIGGRPVARTMRDGTQICQAFQHGKCGAKGKCMQGVRRCGVVIRGDRGARGQGLHRGQEAPQVRLTPDKEAASLSGSEADELPQPVPPS